MWAIHSPEGIRLLDENHRSALGTARRLIVVSGHKVPFEFAPVVAIDASGETMDGWYEIVPEGDGRSFVVRSFVPAEWLARAAYPVRLDPTVTINASGSGNAWPWDGAIGRANGFSYQHCFSAALMNNTSGTITKFFVKFNESTDAQYPRVVITMGETNRTSTTATTTFASNFDVGGQVVVFDGPLNVVVNANVYFEIPLQTPFTYSGTRSILIDIRHHPLATGFGGNVDQNSSAGVDQFRVWDHANGSNSTVGFAVGQQNMISAQFEFASITLTTPAGNSLGTNNEGDPLNLQFAATGGTAPYTYSATGLPTGATLSSSGLLSGTLAGGTAGSYNVQVTVTDSLNTSAVVPVSWTINAPPITLTTPAGNTLAEAYEGDTANVQFAATGGVSPYTYSASGLPTGISMSASGLLSGTLAAGTAGTHTITVTVTDANNSTVNIPVLWTIYADPVPSAVLADGTVGFAFSETFTASGGKAPLTWAISSVPALPASMSFNTSTGTLSGTPAAGDEGTYALTITVSDANAQTGQITPSWTIGPAASLVQPTLPAGTDTGAYSSAALTVNGGVGPFTFSATGLPSGLNINASTGAITGTIAAGESANSPFAVTLTATDTNAAPTSVNVNLVVNAAPSLASGQTLNGTLGLPFNATLTTSGGTGPFTWAVTGLPSGLTVNASTGAITGTIDTSNLPGTVTIDVTVTDANGVTANTTMNVAIAAEPININAGGGCSCSGRSTDGSPTWMLGMLLILTLLLIRRRHA